MELRHVADRLGELTGLLKMMHPVWCDSLFIVRILVLCYCLQLTFYTSYIQPLPSPFVPVASHCFLAREQHRRALQVYWWNEVGRL